MTRLLWVCWLSASVMSAQVARETVLHSFGSPPKGAYPMSGLLRDQAGNLYGTTEQGGVYDAGTIFKLDPAGNATVLYSFTGGADGNGPVAGLVADTAGNLYGTTHYGGSAGVGVLYRLDPTRQLTILHTFTGGAGGESLQSPLIIDAAGRLYGTALGGARTAGRVYRMDSAAGQFDVLHTFTGAGDGGYPNASGVVRDPGGNLYGTTTQGGAGGLGVVYKLDSAGNETVLYSFWNSSIASIPAGGVIRDPAGNLYGAANGGNAHSGVVYRLDPNGVYTTLYSFPGGDREAHPLGSLLRDAAGNLYGTTSYSNTDRGVVFKLDPSGNEMVLHRFAGGADGGLPFGGLVTDSSGNLYGTATYGGAIGSGLGVVYRIDGAGQQTILYTFPYPPGGSTPTGLTRDAAGNLYGTTFDGGSAGAGVVYKLDPSGRKTILYVFRGDVDGGNPSSGVIRDAAGNLYGTTKNGGAAHGGVVFKIDPAGNETVLHSFTGGADGANPSSGLIADASGSLYGVTYAGGPSGAGVVYKVDTAGHEAVLYAFTGGADGALPAGRLARDASGNLYGTAAIGLGGQGVVYKLDPNGVQTVLYRFTGGADGAAPQSVILDASGTLYGVAKRGGSNNRGVVYKLDPNGQLTVLHTFTGGSDGGGPEVALLRDAVGNLYGTTTYGGDNAAGVVFKLDPAGQQTVLYTFTGGTDGASPAAPLIADSAGNLYGTADIAGVHQGGVVFQLSAR